MDAVDYKNGTKNNWRAFVWNRLKERIKDRRNALVLYLPGSKALDVVEAERRGFRRSNMIAIERNKKIVKVLRANRLNTIHDKLENVLHGWPQNVPVDIVVADFQGGLSFPATDAAIGWLLNPAFGENSRLLVNMLRGREQRGHGFNVLLNVVRRKANEYTQAFRKLAGDAPANCGNVLATINPATHRPLMLLAALHNAAAAYQAYQITADTESKEFEEAFLYALDNPKTELGFMPMPSYSSGKLAFDSAIFTKYKFPETVSSEITESTHRKIAAALAVRTQRLNGQLLH